MYSHDVFPHQDDIALSPCHRQVLQVTTSIHPATQEIGMDVPYIIANIYIYESWIHICTYIYIHRHIYIHTYIYIIKINDYICIWCIWCIKVFIGFKWILKEYYMILLWKIGKSLGLKCDSDNAICGPARYDCWVMLIHLTWYWYVIYDIYNIYIIYILYIYIYIYIIYI